ncbi:ribonuclease P protein component [Limnohabitans sp.]|uniref:ribonuclease P protein component n=1 Tax=Limnohabitans sp. TaxID=1907725 RepID=UPI00286F28A7|nr:ribonuclease P protein component [Limnohabitans sp.]
MTVDQTRDPSAVERLHQWSEFQAVMSAGSVARTPHFVLHQWQPPAKASTGSGFEETPTLFVDGVLMMGALTPKRWAKRAVTRNLIRRQIHAVSREFEKGLTPTAYVVRLRAAFNPSSFVSASSDVLKQTVREELKQLFSRVSAA